jgi:hypothetical protein
MNKLTSKIIPTVSVLYKIDSTKGTLKEERRDYGHDVCINRIRKEGSNRTQVLSCCWISAREEEEEDLDGTNTQ